MLAEIWESIKSLFIIAPSDSEPAPTTTPPLIQNTAGKSYAAGRITTDHPYTRYSQNQILKAEDKLNRPWQLQEMDERIVPMMKTTDLLELLSEVSPDFNRALHDFVQFVITPGELVADTPEGQAIIDEALDKMRSNKETFITKLEKAATSVFMHGAIFSELTLDLQGIGFENINIIDATLAEFAPSKDPILGDTYRLGQHKEGKFLDLHDDPTVDYIAFDPVPGSPFGRSLSAAAIFPIVFSLQVLKDLRQVVRTQGYPVRYGRVDRVVLKEAGYIDTKAQDTVINDTKEQLLDWAAAPAGPYTDVPFIGSEWEIEQIEGAGRGLSGIETLIQIIERMIVRALKTHSIIFGINSASGLSDNSPIQSELHYIFIDSIQRKIENWVEGIFTEVLRARGNTATVSFKLKRINTLVNKQRIEIKQVEADIIQSYVTNGYISPQEARTMIRHPSPFDEIDTILKSDAIPADAQREPDEVIEVDEEETNE